MKEIQDYQQDIASIRSLMERSAKFLSLSGLSGVLSGVYALTGATLAYYLIYYPNAPFGFRFNFINENAVILKLLLIAVIVLILSLSTGFWFSIKKARKLGLSVWNNSSRQLLVNLLIPLLTGGVFILILVMRGYFAIVSSAFLLFYGLALVNGSHHTYKELRYLGISEIILGLCSALLPGYGLILWAFGFGVLHIVYGLVVHYRYDQ